jgi:hypothetical protein
LPRTCRMSSAFSPLWRKLKAGSKNKVNDAL